MEGNFLFVLPQIVYNGSIGSHEISKQKDKAMTDAQQREAARQFFYRWQGKGKEDEHARSYWIELLSDVFDVDRVTERVEFEKKVIGADSNTKRIDVYIPETRVLIEQKSLGIPLDKPQAGHNGQTPYEQAKYYDNYLPFDEKARWIITSNFAEIWIYDMNQRSPEPVKLTLSDLQSKYHLLDFLVNKKQNRITEEVELSKAAGELVGKIRDRFLTQYNDPLAKRTQKSLNILCVRLVFCFYAEDAGLFGPKDAFSKYILRYDPGDIRGKLIELFKALDTPLDKRADMYLPEAVESFPYVNGGLFGDESIIIPKITRELKETLAEAAKFDWSKISPTIFGAVFESTLNPETRRAGGMHYTSIENIHKVIDPLFLDDLKAELKEIRSIAVLAVQKKRLQAFQDKLSGLVFFDPACGSGNFLTETYLSLRRLENEVLRLKVQADSKLLDGQISFGFEEDSPIKVNIHQFYGIEINDFAVAVAKTALWIAEAQTMKETEDVIHTQMDFFPLKDYQGITEGNALRIQWEKACPVDRLSYIIGNPPFVGYSLQTKDQKADILALYVDEKGKPYKTAGKIDYVSGWYWKSAKLMTEHKRIRAALVSTNSITQGEQVAGVWKPLFDRFGIHIDFAYRTFIWDSEADQKAHVHCVIVGFSIAESKKKKLLFSEGTVLEVDNINFYLVDAANIFVESERMPLCDVPQMLSGNRPTDGGHLILSPEERDELLSVEPGAKPFIKKFMMGYEFINRKDRYCLWLVDALPSDLRKLPHVWKRVDQCRIERLNSPDAGRRKLAETPHLFREQLNPDHTIVVPKVSSERRRYIPMGYIDKDTIAGDKLFIIPNATLYHLGVLMSNVHMAWMRAITGRLKSDYSYSIFIDYNCFVWPSVSSEQQERIADTARQILEARNKYPTQSLADLYDPLTMPPELRKAHQLNDAAVMKAYGMPIKDTDEAACVAWLMRLYQEKVNELNGKK